MRCTVWVGLLAGWVALGIWYGAGRTGGSGPVAFGASQPENTSKSPPPLRVDSTAPRLLDASPKTTASARSKPPKADNQPCYVCHANYQDEPLAARHVVADIGCVQCHGESTAHRNDENNTTPPDTMYPAENIDPACIKCHPTHDVPARNVLARSAERRLAERTPQEIVCTDCHGDHRLKVRTVRWDKKTGRCISEGSPQVAPPPGNTKK